MMAGVRCLIRRFPGAAEKIEQLYCADENFRDLSHDYWLCIKGLRRCEKNREDNQDLIIEYQALLAELEREAMKYIEEVENR